MAQQHKLQCIPGITQGFVTVKCTCGVSLFLGICTGDKQPEILHDQHIIGILEHTYVNQFYREDTLSR